MLVIRLFRTGKKNQPYFKIVVTDKKRPPRGGRFVEQVGNLNPIKKENALKIDRIKYWISVGAKPSPRVYNLLISEKVIEGKKIDVHKKSKKKEDAKAPEAPKVVPITPAAAPEEVKLVEAVDPVPVEGPKVEEVKAEEIKEEVSVPVPAVEEPKLETPKEEVPVETEKKPE